MNQLITNRLSEQGCIFDGAVGVSFDALIRSVIDLDFIVRMDSVLGCYLSKYQFHVSRKQIPPIEELDHDSKLYYWNETKKYTEDRERRIKASKVIYLIDQLCDADSRGTN